MQRSSINESVPQTLNNNPYINKVLDCSTAHITNNDNNLLKEASEAPKDSVNQNPIIAHEYEYGFLVYVPEDKDIRESALKYGYSKEFTNLIDKARELDCKYLQLDSDGVTYNNIFRFNW